jgi:hypothetical protein
MSESHVRIKTKINGEAYYEQAIHSIRWEWQGKRS